MLFALQSPAWRRTNEQKSNKVRKTLLFKVEEKTFRRKIQSIKNEIYILNYVLNYFQLIHLHIASTAYKKLWTHFYILFWKALKDKKVQGILLCFTFHETWKFFELQKFSEETLKLVSDFFLLRNQFMLKFFNWRKKQVFGLLIVFVWRWTKWIIGWVGNVDY